MTPELRPATESDLDAVAAMVAALNAEAGRNRAAAAGAAALRAAFLGEAACGRLLVAARGAELLGYVTLHPTYETEFASRGAYLGDLYVVPDAKRAGIGRALVAAAAAEARRLGGEHLWWTALPGNAGGQAFHRAIGATGEPVQAFALAFATFDRLAEAGGAHGP